MMFHEPHEHVHYYTVPKRYVCKECRKTWIGWLRMIEPFSIEEKRKIEEERSEFLKKRLEYIKTGLSSDVP